MVEVVGGRPSVPGWLAARLGNASPKDGDPGKNQFLPDDGTVETNPVKTTHSVFQKGTQGRR
jgi:hypothetical protein